MRNAHLLSAGLSPDPFYDASHRTPAAPGSSLFGDVPSGAAPCWLYAPGDLDGHLMARMRQDAFAVCTGIFHPGSFRRPHGLVTFTQTLDLKSPPAESPVSLWHSGELRLDINSTLALRSGCTSAPREVRENLAPFLKAGRNEIKFTLTRLDEPPCLLLKSPWLSTGATWTCSSDLTSKTPAAAYTADDVHCFPHQESLPKTRITVPLSADGIANFGCVLLGRPFLPPSDFAGLGESVAETLTELTPAEQRPLFDDQRERAFQFVAVRGATLASRKLEAEISLHPARYEGAFACSDERLTRIWQHAAASLRVSLRELTVDGLKRDRLPWAGDAYIATLGNAAVFGEHRCIQRTLNALAPEDPAHCPTNGIIDYDACWIISVAAQWQFSGDIVSIRLLWPAVERILAALRGREDEHGFLRHEGTWLFLDWIEFDKSARSVALQALYAGALQAAAWLAGALGHGERVGELIEKQERLGDALRETYWDASQPCAQPMQADRHAAFLSVYFNVASSTMVDGEKAGPLAATAYMRYFEAAAQARGGDLNAMLKGVSDYWGGMLDAGASTFWEGFNPAETGDARYAFYGRPFGKSLCHAWACGPLPLLSFELAGLRPTWAGWSEVICLPNAIPLKWACATIPTPHGPLRWDYENGELRIDVPAGVKLHCKRGTWHGTTLVIPCGEPSRA